jgi:hypothetical protein
MFGMSGEQVEQVTSSPQLCYYEKLIVHTEDIVQPNDIVMPSKFSQDVNFLLKFGNVLGIVP